MKELSDKKDGRLKVELYFFSTEVPEDELRGKTTIVIDALRGSSSIIAAIGSGCKEIIPAESVEAATELASKLGRKDVFLCGERDGRKIDGFDMGNSPLEYTPEGVSGKTLVFVSTNSSGALKKSRLSCLSVIASFSNAGAVSRYVAHHTEGSVVILCSGNLDTFSIEDAVCGGMILANLSEIEESRELETNDAGLAAQILYRHYENDLLGMLKTCSHGRYLIDIGFEKDIEFCARVDALDVVPVLVEGRIVKGKVS